MIHLWYLIRGGGLLLVGLAFLVVAVPTVPLWLPFFVAYDIGKHWGENNA